MDVLEHTNMDGQKLVPMLTMSQKLGQGDGPPLSDPTIYQWDPTWSAAVCYHDAS